MPLADSTMYGMGLRGEFPRGFDLTPRCVVWDLSEVGAWLEEGPSDSRSGRLKTSHYPDVRLRRAKFVRTSIMQVGPAPAACDSGMPALADSGPASFG